MKTITLSSGESALVDDEDFERINAHKWQSGKGYAYRHEWSDSQRKRILMHREVLNAPDGFDVDHKYGDTLDNRKDNLRLCTHQQNMWNRKKSLGCSSQYKGVSWHKGASRWMARIYVNRKAIELGYFNSEVAAARKYNEAARALHGEFARLNLV